MDKLADAKKTKMNHLKVLVLIVSVLISAVVIWGIVGTFSGKVYDKLPDKLNTIKTVAEMQARIKREMPEESIVGLELESDNDVTSYSVHLTSGEVVIFEAFTGEELEQPDDKDDALDKSQVIPADFITGVSIQRSIEVAQKEKSDAEAIKVELGVKNDTIVYSVYFTDGSRVDVRAEDGSIK